MMLPPHPSPIPLGHGRLLSDSVSQSTHPDLMFTLGYLSTARSYVPDFNATDYPAFTLAAAAEVWTFTNLPTQVDYTYQVNNQHVCSFLASATILCIHWMWIQSS